MNFNICVYSKKNNIVIKEHVTYFKTTFMSWQEIKSSARILYIINYCSFATKYLVSVLSIGKYKFYFYMLEKLQLQLKLW